MLVISKRPVDCRNTNAYLRVFSVSVGDLRRRRRRRRVTPSGVPAQLLSRSGHRRRFHRWKRIVLATVSRDRSTLVAVCGDGRHRGIIVYNIIINSIIRRERSFRPGGVHVSVSQDRSATVVLAPLIETNTSTNPLILLAPLA